MSQWSLEHGHVKGHHLNTTAVCSSFVPSDILQVNYKHKMAAVGWKLQLNVSVFLTPGMKRSCVQSILPK